MASISTKRWKNRDGSESTRHKVKFRDAKGVWRERLFETMREAKRFVETISEHRKVGFVEPGHQGATFRDAADDFLSACERGRDGNPPLEPQTVREYRGRLRRNILPLIGDQRIASVTTDDFKAFRDDLLKTKRVRSSLRTDLRIAKAVFAHAVDAKMTTTNPTVGVKIATDNRRETPAGKAIHIHTKEQMAAILAAGRRLRGASGRRARLGKIWQRFEAMMHLMVFCGLRMSELRGLPRDAIDLKAKTVRIYQRADNAGRIGPPKSKHGYRTIHLPTGLATLLEEWIKTPAMGDLLFPTSTGKPINHRNLASRMWQKAQEEAGVDVLNPHAARHFFASMRIDQGANLKTLQEEMGHQDPMFTLRVYGHLFKDPDDIARRQAMADQMESSLLAFADED